MRTFLLLLLSACSCFAQGGSYCTMSTWEPRNLVTKAGLVASYDPGNTNTLTHNGAASAGTGISLIDDLARSIRTGNLVFPSEDLSATWTSSHFNAFGATDTGAAGAGSFANTARTTDPLGGNTADFVQEDNAATSTHYMSLTPSGASFSSGTVGTFSICAKADTVTGGTNIMLYAVTAGVGKGFDLGSGTAVAVSGITSPTSSSITSLGSGWYLCKITFTAGVTEKVRWYSLTNSAGTYLNSYSGDNTKGVFLWGASLVKSDWTQVTGATLATGYQVTTTAAYAPPDLAQGTAANQPIVSRKDNAGNLLRNSETHSDSTWTKTRVNSFLNTTDVNERAAGSGSFADSAEYPDPAGGNKADFIQEDTTAANTHDISESASVSAGSYRLSAFLRPFGRTWARLVMSLGSDNLNCSFNLGTGAVGSVLNGGSATGAAGTISSAPNGFYLCTLSGTLTTSGSMTSRIRLAIADLSGGATYDGDNTSGILMWGISVTPSTWTPVTGTTDSLGYVATTTVPIFPGLSGRPVLYFDGSAYYMKTLAFPLNQPTEIYSLAMPWTWTLNDAMFDGYALNSGKLYQSATTPNIRYTAGTVGAEFTPPAAGVWRVSNVVFDGANSRMSTNSGAFTVSDAGAGNMGGFTLGAAGTVGTTFWNGLRGRELICNKTNQTAEASYLRWGLLKQALLY